MSALMTHLAVRRGRQLIAPFMWLVHCSRFFSARLFSAIIPHLPAAAADSRKPPSTTNYIPRVCVLVGRFITVIVGHSEDSVYG